MSTEIPQIIYAVEPTLTLDDYISILESSSLALRRPTNRDRLSTMLNSSNLIITARLSSTNAIVGLSRSWSDGFTCYLADLAVSKEMQGRGVGRELIQRMRREVGESVTVLLLSAPGMEGFYEGVGMKKVGDEGVSKGFIWPRPKKD